MRILFSTIGDISSPNCFHIFPFKFIRKFASAHCQGPNIFFAAIALGVECNEVQNSGQPATRALFSAYFSSLSGSYHPFHSLCLGWPVMGVKVNRDASQLRMKSGELPTSTSSSYWILNIIFSIIFLESHLISSSINYDIVLERRGDSPPLWGILSSPLGM